VWKAGNVLECAAETRAMIAIEERFADLRG
jgi:hypothetical protein